ncbi:hypothetical protein Agub_g9391 [Astrephomene gubernaculifera]|uniref:Uncharacterized protein n=1 Tax=Astrephomene gubernaculifera TaxID=47775 RepID=A0AAD3DVZ5_9CHLO|nr:hypothetical protein Agub_g9391 [Astrephomene gubernaculifera]
MLSSRPQGLRPLSAASRRGPVIHHLPLLRRPSITRTLKSIDVPCQRDTAEEGCATTRVSANLQQQQQTSHTVVLASRRRALFTLAAGALSLSLLPGSVHADEDAKLPKEYRQLVKRLSEGLRETIEAEASGASEAEVRRKADPAKDTVREFVRKWRDNARVSGDITHAEIKEALAELGEYYMAHGQRARLSPGVRDSVLGHLDAARAALGGQEGEEGEEGKVLGLF